MYKNFDNKIFNAFPFILICHYFFHPNPVLCIYVIYVCEEMMSSTIGKGGTNVECNLYAVLFSWKKSVFKISIMKNHVIENRIITMELEKKK